MEYEIQPQVQSNSKRMVVFIFNNSNSNFPLFLILIERKLCALHNVYFIEDGSECCHRDDFYQGEVQTSYIL